MNIHELPISIRPHLAELADRLWTGHASVMIGAGFSKNAINKNGEHSLPSWQELGDIFYEKIHGSKPSGELRYLNPLKLAEELQAAFGRTTLDQTLKKHIPDKDFEPADSHIKLLELPWSDVFTTNYDTLLERTSDNVISRRYDIVSNQKEIIYSNRPRIIKLHGSFPSERPLIITEEDYRIYPKRFAPFVNTVQQSLLENTLCLIGFSGDDPNFLQWIGWINDNIGKENSPKIYMIGILNLSEAQKTLLNNRNIVPIDIGAIPGVNGQHKKAVDLFLDCLHKQRLTRENLDWGMEKQFYFRDSDDIGKVIENWRSERLNYPNWIICPQENRENLWEVTSQYVGNGTWLEELTSPVDLDFAYEMNWRSERCLIPILNDHALYLEKILERYSFFDAGVDQSTIENRNKWLHLNLSLLRFYREEGFKDKWTASQKRIELLKNELSPDHLAWFNYEKVLMALMEIDITNAKAVLADWPLHETNPYWNAKKAMLLAEFGRTEEAFTILENGLTTVRKRLNLAPVGNDYRWVSQEAYLMYLLRNIYAELRHSKDLSVQSEDFNERWNTLLQFKCSPKQEIRLFEASLRHKYVPEKDKVKKDSFEIGVTTTTHTLGTQDKEALNAYAYLRFLEDAGIPPNLYRTTNHTKILKSALERVSQYSPSWAYGVFNRSKDRSLADIVLNRSSVRKLEQKYVDNLILEHLEKFQALLPEYRQDNVANTYVNKLTLLFSRLCVKCSDDVRLKLYEFYINAVNDGAQLSNLKDLWKNLNASSSNSIKREVLPLLIKTPVIDQDLASAQLDFLEPFENLRLSFPAGQVPDKLIVDDLLRMAGNDEKRRNRALTRLIYFRRQNLLTKPQDKKLSDAIWKFIGKNGFPSHTNFYYHGFMEIEKKSDRDIPNLFKAYILNNSFDIQGDTKGVGMGGGDDRYAKELWYGSASFNAPERIKWTKQELESIFEKCAQWWETDKKFVTLPIYRSEGMGGSIYKEFVARFKLLCNIISRVFGFQKSTLKSTDTLSKLIALINDMELNGIPMLKAKVVFSDLLDYDENQFLYDTEQGLISGDTDAVVDAFQAAAISIYYLRHFNNTKVLETIAQPLKWRNTDLMDDALEVVTNILEYQPDSYKDIARTLLDVLGFAFDYTDISEIDNEKVNDLQQLLLVRQKAMKLAGILFKQYKETVPEVLIKWQKIATDTNEFGDIRIQWNQE